MPHQIIEYSANLDADMDIDALVEAMHNTAVEIDALPIGGIRTRAARRDHYRARSAGQGRLCVSVLCASIRHRRGPGHGFRALLPHPVLGEPPRQECIDRPPAIRARWRARGGALRRAGQTSWNLRHHATRQPDRIRPQRFLLVAPLDFIRL